MNIRVLVIDDHPVVRDAVVRALTQDPALHVVGEGATGQEALDLAAQLSPDVMLLDLHLPVMSGLSVIDALRSSQPQIRIVVLTASEDANNVLDAIAAGALGYLSKRSLGEELRQAVITVYGGGSVVTPDLASHLLREFSSASRGEQSTVRPLVGRELQVLRLVVQGMTDKEIAKELFISPRTVQGHLTRIREKTGLRRRTELARWAVEHAIA